LAPRGEGLRRGAAMIRWLIEKSPATLKHRSESPKRGEAEGDEEAAKQSGMARLGQNNGSVRVKTGAKKKLTSLTEGVRGLHEPSEQHENGGKAGPLGERSYGGLKVLAGEKITRSCPSRGRLKGRG